MRLEDAKVSTDIKGEIQSADVLRAVERVLGAKPGETLGSTIVRDAATNTAVNVVSFADGRDYVPLPAILGQILWQMMEQARVAASVETYMGIWKAGSDVIEGASPGEDHPLVRQIRASIAATPQVTVPAPRRGPIPEGVKVFAGDRRIA